MLIENGVEGLVGNTPLFYAKSVREVDLFVKLEKCNPSGSVKDRAALSMLEDAEARKDLTKNASIFLATSGNMGISLATLARTRGYNAVLVMPENMSEERKSLLRELGAELVLTSGEGGMAESVETAERLAKARGGVLFRQFESEANARAHERTAREIMADLPVFDAVVVPVGTGGTVTGIGRTLKKAGVSAQIVAVEPSASPVLSGGKRGTHRIQGIGAGFVPPLLDKNAYDRVVGISDEEAFFEMRAFYEREGISVGISSGAAIAAAKSLKKNGKKLTVVAILPDGGERYRSLFSE